VNKILGAAALSVSAVVAVVLSSGVSVAAPAQIASSGVTDAPSRSVAVAPRALPRGSIAHYSEFWTWFGPRNWVAAYSAQGITIFGPKSQDILDYGSSMVICASAATKEGSIQAYFAAKRQELKAGRGLKKLRLTPGQITQQDPGTPVRPAASRCVARSGTTTGSTTRCTASRETSRGRFRPPGTPSRSRRCGQCRVPWLTSHRSCPPAVRGPDSRPPT